MAIRYVDLLNGNDANNGTTFALRKKTITSASTGLTGGDTIRVMKSPDPTSLGSCTWSSAGRTVTLPQAATAHINACDSGWTAATNITITYPTATAGYFKYGANPVQLAVGAAFTTGKMAYAPCSTVDLSAYQQVSMFFLNTTAITANQIYIDLCSDTTGDVPVLSFALPSKATQTNYISPFTFDNGAALPANINSIAIRAASDPGTPNLVFDHIIACKATSVADSLTLNSIVGLNTPDEPEWFPIKSINGTSVELDTSSNWCGSTGSLTTYKMEPIRFQQIFAASGTQFPSQNSSTNYTGWTSTGGSSTTGTLNIEFGWDTSTMSTQNGYTAVDFHVYSCPGIPGGADFIYFNKLIGIRNHSAIYNSTASYVGIGELHIVSPYTISLATSSTGGTVIFDKVYLTCFVNSGSSSQTQLIKGNILSYKHYLNAASAVNVTVGGSRNIELNHWYFHGLAKPSWTTTYNAIINNFYANPGSITPTTGILTGTNSNIKILNFYLYNVWAYLFYPQTTGFKVSITNLILSNALTSGLSYFLANGIENSISVQNYNNTGVFKGAFDYGTLSSVTTPVHTAGGIAWEFIVPTYNSYRLLTSSEWYKVQNAKIGEIPVKANKLVTIKIWTQRKFTTTAGALFVKPSVPGVTDYVVATSSAAANTWEQLTITFTPTINSVIDLYVGGQYDNTNATQAFYFDDLSVTIAD